MARRKSAGAQPAEPKPKPKLTPKQEAFAVAYFETGNAAEAYRRAYDVSDAARDPWIRVEACQLLDNPNISLRVLELQDQAAKLSMYTLKAAADEYEEARLLAMKGGNASAAVSAITGKVKLFGLEAPTRHKAEVSGPNGGPIRVEDASAAVMAALARKHDAG